MRRLAVFFTLLSLLTVAIAEESRVTRAVKGNFADIREALVIAVENHGLVLNPSSHIGEMLERTGASIGARKKIFEQAEIIQFCSAGLSRQVMEANPHDIVLCPFSISIYTLPGQSGTTWVSYRKPFGPSARIIERLLQEIVAEAGE